VNHHIGYPWIALVRPRVHAGTPDSAPAPRAPLQARPTQQAGDIPGASRSAPHHSRSARTAQGRARRRGSAAGPTRPKRCCAASPGRAARRWGARSAERPLLHAQLLHCLRAGKVHARPAATQVLLGQPLSAQLARQRHDRQAVAVAYLDRLVVGRVHKHLRARARPHVAARSLAAAVPPALQQPASQGNARLGRAGSAATR